MDKFLSSPSRFIVGITGASGSIYGYRLVQELLSSGFEVRLIVTDTGRKVMAYEMEKPFEDLIKTLHTMRQSTPGVSSSQSSPALLHTEDLHDLFSPIASGSSPVAGMAIAPCSMGTLGKLAACSGENLLTRAADVCLKERRPLVLLARETPLNAIHLQNMLTLHQAGAVILPPVPAFYHRPRTVGDIVDQTVGRALSCLCVKSPLQTPWTRETCQNIPYETHQTGEGGKTNTSYITDAAHKSGEPHAAR